MGEGGAVVCAVSPFLRFSVSIFLRAAQMVRDDPVRRPVLHLIVVHIGFAGIVKPEDETRAAQPRLRLWEPLSRRSLYCS